MVTEEKSKNDNENEKWYFAKPVKIFGLAILRIVATVFLLLFIYFLVVSFTIIVLNLVGGYDGVPSVTKIWEGSVIVILIFAKIFIGFSIFVLFAVIAYSMCAMVIIFIDQLSASSLDLRKVEATTIETKV